jgi:hypothetical protein
MAKGSHEPAKVRMRRRPGVRPGALSTNCRGARNDGPMAKGRYVSEARKSRAGADSVGWGAAAGRPAAVEGRRASRAVDAPGVQVRQAASLRPAGVGAGGTALSTAQPTITRVIGPTRRISWRRLRGSKDCVADETAVRYQEEQGQIGIRRIPVVGFRIESCSPASRRTASPYYSDSSGKSLLLYKPRWQGKG